MADPIRQGVQDTIEDFHQAGIATIMLTGDQSPTAAVGGSLALQLLALMMAWAQGSPGTDTADAPR